MCIIWIKNKGLDLPTKEVIETMCENNPHGNGFCYAENGKVIIKKGFMDFESFYEALVRIPNIKDINLVGHCRITTHGSTSKGNCHPFPLSNNIEDLKKSEINTDVAIIHNGVIRSIEADKKNDLSDTMTYIKDRLYNRYVNNNIFMDSKFELEEIQKEIGSKMVIMKSDGNYHIIGDFNTDEKGYIYSNYSYVRYDYSKLYDDYKYAELDDNDIYGDEFVLLEFSDYVIIDGNRVYGDEFDFVMTADGVYIDDWEYGATIKIGDNAYDCNGKLINFRNRYKEMLEEVF